MLFMSGWKLVLAVLPWYTNIACWTVDVHVAVRRWLLVGRDTEQGVRMGTIDVRMFARKSNHQGRVTRQAREYD